MRCLHLHLGTSFSVYEFHGNLSVENYEHQHKTAWASPGTVPAMTPSSGNDVWFADFSSNEVATGLNVESPYKVLRKTVVNARERYDAFYASTTASARGAKWTWTGSGATN